MNGKAQIMLQMKRKYVTTVCAALNYFESHLPNGHILTILILAKRLGGHQL